MAETKNLGVFSAMGFEEYDAGEFMTAWHIGNSDKIETRKYGKTPFNPTLSKIEAWVWKNYQKIRAEKLTLEQQEELMIAEGVITREEI